MVWLGIALIIIAFGLIIGELFTGSGILLGIGIVCLILGVVFIFFFSSQPLQINWYLVGPLIALFIALIVFVVQRVIQVHREQVKTGTEEMIGGTAVVRETLNPEGTVFFQGELWNAISTSGKIESGSEVTITQVDRLTLTVMKKETGQTV